MTFFCVTLVSDRDRSDVELYRFGHNNNSCFRNRLIRNSRSLYLAFIVREACDVRPIDV
jgi:hypothetical protein